MPHGRQRPDGEMDITTDFGSVILGSNPGRGTTGKGTMRRATILAERIWFSGRTRPCQGRDGSSILPIRTDLETTFTPVQKHVHTGDKGHVFGTNVCKIDSK